MSTWFPKRISNDDPKVWRSGPQMAQPKIAKMAQPRKKMGHPDLSAGRSRRFGEVFSEGVWAKVKFTKRKHLCRYVIRRGFAM